MLTWRRAPVVAPAPAYPPYRPFAVHVRRLLALSPHLVRVTVAGPDLTVLGATGLDQRITLMLPRGGPDGPLSDVGAQDEQTIRAGSWYARWRDLPDDERCPLRTYTVRDARPQDGELDIDMVLHEPRPDEGPATRWLRAARPGDPLVVVAPDARSAQVTGVDWHPGTARHLLLAGDETAAPAICAILEQADRPAQAFVEVATAADILSVYPAGGARITWLARDGGCATAEGFRSVAPHGRLLRSAVRSWLARHTTAVAGALGAPEDLEDLDVDAELLWDAPPDPRDGDFYAWVAGEAGMVRDLRRLLVRDVGISRSNVAFMGYWRDGRPGPQ